MPDIRFERFRLVTGVESLMQWAGRQIPGMCLA
jgi:hypothetical protein